MYITAAQVFGADHFARRGLDQWRPGKKDSALFFHDNCDVRHGGHIGPARRAGTHDHSDLGDALGAHPGLVIENPAKVITVGKDLILIGQVGPSAVDQIDAGQVVFLGNFLSAQVFFDGNRIVGATLYRRVVADDHHLMPGHPTDARDHTGARRGIVIHIVGGCRTNLKKWGAGIKQPGNPVAGQHFAPAQMPIPRFLPAPKGCGLRGLGHDAQGL